jgi:hypothetical protein
MHGGPIAATSTPTHASAVSVCILRGRLVASDMASVVVSVGVLSLVRGAVANHLLALTSRYPHVRVA